MSAPPACVDALLDAARACGVDRLDAQQLVAGRLGKPRSWVLAHGDAPVTADAADALRVAFERRAAGEPLAYLLGEKEFHGLRLEVTPDVLVPRPDTETLVDWALELLAPAGALGGVAVPQVADLGTGSGAIALALKHRCPRACVRASDASAAALAVARRNGVRLGLAVDWLEGDWWQPYGAPALHLAVSNPPYIAAGDPHLAGLRHEPPAALTPGGDGLDAIRRLVGGAAQHVAPGGWLLLEHGFDQADAVGALLAGAGFDAIAHRRDLAGHRRCTGGRLPRR